MTAAKITVLMYSRLRRDRPAQPPVPLLRDFPLPYEQMESEIKQRKLFKRSQYGKTKGR